MTEIAQVIPIAIRRLKRVEMRLPPPHLFDKLLGCSGNRRFFALCWSRAVRAPLLNDGFLETVGATDPYRVWRHHPAVIAALTGYNIGDAAETAGDLLLVDRKSRVLYVGKSADVLVVLDYQKRGVVDLLPETGHVETAGDSRTIPGDGAVIAFKRYKNPLMSNIKQIHELERWLDTH